ncbi:MAG: glycosyltransferase, partial [Selenomonadaceae bacterium]|nr:glycosyltransferase [Selenomonadaceae bacterium]
MSEPKISVIIPMYNAEKFIRQCLISVLASKFKDYEVIVVDDCSKDKLVAEVEKLTAHFDGRLKILSTAKNSGGAGIPRNVGIKNAAGKYVTFLDADDFILPTALENFFDVAEKFQADVVHTEKFLTFNDTGASNFNWNDLTLRKDETGEPVEVPELEPSTHKERISRCIEGKFLWMPWAWGKCYRRDFLIDNKIFLPDMNFTEDLVFSFQCLCLAKNYLRVPFVTSIYRMNQNSISKKIISSEAGVKLWLNSIARGVSLIC